MSVPRILIDARMVGETLNGVGRHTVLLAKGLAELPRLDYDPVFLCQPGMGARFSGFETVEVRTPYLDPREIATLPAVLYRKKAALYHSPSHASLAGAPCPWIVTIHDTVPLRFGNPFEQAYFQGVTRSFAERSKRVVTVSQTSRREIEGWLARKSRIEAFLKKDKPLPPIEVVPNAIDPAFARGDPAPWVAAEGVERGKYFFCLSNAKPHKNVGMLVRAFHRFQERHPAHRAYRLVLSLREYANEPGVVSLGPLNDAEARAWARHAAALCFPSVDEGFGLPPLEAGVMGVPIIVSDIPAHREAWAVAPSAEVLWASPHAPEPWSEALARGARGEVRPLSLDARGKILAAYSLARMGSAMDRVYRAVLRPKHS